MHPWHVSLSACSGSYTACQVGSNSVLAGPGIKVHERSDLHCGTVSAVGEVVALALVHALSQAVSVCRGIYVSGIWPIFS